ncbi:hypothetical protein CBR_g47993 [Chara braunii]|uniref:HAT C-terminal dimerisation domain-containing protein n=1 Tax=Chara braunii TaxID=69332 RepID=A0A388M216_CHABU|nr:hypothetical protein CBR_g47993 [Chara braunii]|eukprot:GBG88522.1 hypothetical protein CBR_g47993 [Chara braunii]
MAGGSTARGAIGGQGSWRQLERGEGIGKDIANSSAPSSGVTSTESTPATDPSLSVPQPEGRQKKLQGEKEISKHVEQGQAVVPKGRGEYWLRCRLCSAIWRGTSTRAVEHFMKMLKSRLFRTGEIVHKLVAQGPKVLPSDKKTRYLLQNYWQLHNMSEGGAAANDDDADAVVRRGYEEQKPPVAAGREPVEEMAQRGKESAVGEVLREECDSTTRAGPVQQTTITRWMDNAAQKKLDIAWAEAMFRARISFNFLNFDTTLKLHEVYSEPTEVRFGSVYVMMERLYDRRAVLKQMVEGSLVGRSKAMRWSTTKLQSKADLVFFTSRTEGWWPKLKKVVEVMEPLYVLLRRMDKDGTAPSNLVEYDRLMERMLAEVVLTEEQRRTVLEKAIAMKVMGMWSTMTPAERNWSSMDLVHSKRRNRLNPSTLELVYIHWNMQLLQSGKNCKDHDYIDLWAQFFESLPEAEVNDGSILKDPVEKDKTEEELEECTGDSNLDDEVWKGKTPWLEASSEGEVDESLDDDFELGIPPSILCTTYVGRREAAQRRQERPPTTPFQCTANTTARHNIQSDVELPQTDTDMEMELRPGPINTDEEEADRAKAWADADQEQVQRRMREEEERRAAIPTRIELEKPKKKVGERESEPVGDMGRLEEEKEEAMGQREEEAAHEIGQPGEEEEKMEEQEEEEEGAGMEQREEEMEQE